MTDSWCAKLFRALAVVCTVVCTAGIAPRPAVADDVDTAVDAVVFAGSIAGVPIGANDAGIVKEIVRCAVNKTSILRCARQEIINRLPADAQPFAGCILDQRQLTDCATQEALDRLPPQARGIVNCIAERADIGKCGTQVAVNAVQKQAFDVIDKLKADARSEAGNALNSATGGSINNIIGLARAIQQNDWVSVVQFGGVEVYKQAAKIVLKAVLPEAIPASQVIDPVIDAIIQARFDVVANVIAGARRRDARAVGEAITEAYLLDSILVPCAIPQIPSDVREAVCGTAGKVIHALAEFGGDVVQDVLNAIKDPLGVPDAVWESLVKLEQTIFLGKKHDCPRPEQYYGTNYGRCYHRGVNQFVSRRLDQLIASVDSRCRSSYDRCFTSSHFDELCNPQKAMFRDQIGKLSASVDKAARLYTAGFAQFVRNRGQQAACNAATFKMRDLPQFLDACARAVAVHVPLAGDPMRDDCDRGPSGLSQPVVQRAACERAMQAVNVSDILAVACDAVKPGPPANCHAAIGDGVCGFLDIQCNGPLPQARSYQVSGPDFNITKDEDVDRQSGRITAHFVNALGPVSVRVCAINKVGQICGEPFPARLKTDKADNSCFVGGHPAPKCGSPDGGMKLCKNRCIPKNAPCRQEM
jgi:hypothetical protein